MRVARLVPVSAGAGSRASSADAEGARGVTTSAALVTAEPRCGAERLRSHQPDRGMETGGWLEGEGAKPRVREVPHLVGDERATLYGEQA